MDTRISCDPAAPAHEPNHTQEMAGRAGSLGAGGGLVPVAARSSQSADTAGSSCAHGGVGRGRPATREQPTTRTAEPAFAPAHYRPGAWRSQGRGFGYRTYFGRRLRA